MMPTSHPAARSASHRRERLQLPELLGFASISSAQRCMARARCAAARVPSAAFHRLARP